MLRVYAEEYIELGRLIENVLVLLRASEPIEDLGPSPVDDRDRAKIQLTIRKMLHHCKKIDLPASQVGKERI
jgi:hypothetical protein